MTDMIELRILIMQNWDEDRDALNLRAKRELGATSCEVGDIICRLMTVR